MLPSVSADNADIDELDSKNNATEAFQSLQKDDQMKTIL